jgi:hypothetical protein
MREKVSIILLLCNAPRCSGEPAPTDAAAIQAQGVGARTAFDAAEIQVAECQYIIAGTSVQEVSAWPASPNSDSTPAFPLSAVRSWLCRTRVMLDRLVTLG